MPQRHFPIPPYFSVARLSIWEKTTDRLDVLQEFPNHREGQSPE